MTAEERVQFLSVNPTSCLWQSEHTLSTNQLWVKSCLKILRALKKQKQATPFLKAVNPLLLNLPDYHTIIKHPMDFETIENKLQIEPVPYKGEKRDVHMERGTEDC